MPDDIFEGSFMEFVAGESFVSDSERAWLRWARKVERLLVHDLDGDQSTEGHSDDYAYAAWEAGDSPEEYAAAVRAAYPLSGYDGTLDDFIRRYCAANTITVDGDVFGVMFSTKRRFTEAEARLLIEDGARIFHLKRKG